MDRELKEFEDWCNDHAFELYEKAITGDIDSHSLVSDPRVRGIWGVMPIRTDFEIITILGTKIKVTGNIGLRVYHLINLK